ARAGHRADDGGRRDHGAAGAARVHRAPALVHPRGDGGERERLMPAGQGFLAAVFLLACVSPTVAQAAPPAPRVLDDFESTSAWTAVPASGVEMKLSSEPGPHGNVLRVDFKFTK